MNLRINPIFFLLFAFLRQNLFAANPISTEFVDAYLANGCGCGTPYQDETCICPETPPLFQVGAEAQGGVVFWMTQDGQHGLAVSLVDMGTLAFCDVDLYLGASANGLAIGANGMTPGSLNTSALLASGQMTPAAAACAAYSITVDGITYDDWYLPSMGELSILQTSFATVNTTLGSIMGAGLIQNAAYYSSLESNVNAVQTFDFSTSAEATQFGKATPLLVRAVRAF